MAGIMPRHTLQLNEEQWNEGNVSAEPRLVLYSSPPHRLADVPHFTIVETACSSGAIEVHDQCCRTSLSDRAKQLLLAMRLGMTMQTLNAEHSLRGRPLTRRQLSSLSCRVTEVPPSSRIGTDGDGAQRSLWRPRDVELPKAPAIITPGSYSGPTL